MRAPGIGHEHRRVGGDDELRSVGDEVVHAAQQRQQAGRRERGLRSVEQIQALWADAVVDEREGTTRRASGRGATRRRGRQGRRDLVDECGDAVEVLRAQEVPRPRPARAASDPQRLVERRAWLARPARHALAAALGVEPERDRQTFHQRRLARSVLADDEDDLVSKVERRVTYTANRR